MSQQVANLVPRAPARAAAPRGVRLVQRRGPPRLTDDSVESLYRGAMIVAQNMEEGSEHTVWADAKNNTGPGGEARKDARLNSYKVIVPQEDVDAATIQVCAELSFIRMNAADPEEAIAGALSFLSVIFPAMFSDPVVDGALQSGGTELIVCTAGSVESALMMVSAQSPEEQDLLLGSYGYSRDTIDTRGAYIMMPPLPKAAQYLGQEGDGKYAYPISGICLSLLGKVVNSNNARLWFERRWAAFCSSIGLDPRTPTFFTSMIPTFANLHAIGRFLTAHAPFRRRVVNMMVNKNAQEDFLSNITQTVTKYLRWTEMGHIGLINRYILRLHQHLLFMKELIPFLDRYLVALSKLSKTENNMQLWCYAKIMHEKKDVEYLNRQNFRLLTFIATKLGESYMPSLSLYAGSDTTIANELGKIANRAIRLAWAVNDLPAVAEMIPDDVHTYVSSMLTGTEGSEEALDEPGTDRDMILRQ